MFSRSAAALLRILAPLGVLVSILLVRQHVLYATGAPLDSTFCRVGGPFDCAAIEASGFAAWRGIPTASVGVFYFFLLSLLAWGLRPGAGPHSRSRWQSLLALATLPALLVAWGLAMLSALVIGNFCAGCTAVYLIVLLSAASPVLFAPRRYLASVARAPREALAALSQIRQSTSAVRRFAALALLAVAAAVNFAAPAWMIRRAAARDILEVFLSQPVVELRPARPGLAEGETGAPLQIVIFTDFACPYCRDFENRLRPLLDSRKGRYRLAYKHYPLSKECNPVMDGANFDHPRACRLAQLAEGLAELDRFYPWARELYGVGKEDLYPAMKRIADGAGIAYTDWIGHTTSPGVQDHIEQDIAEGLALGLRALPAVFLNGRYLNSLDSEKLDALFSAVEAGARPAAAEPSAP